MSKIGESTVETAFNLIKHDLDLVKQMAQKCDLYYRDSAITQCKHIITMALTNSLDDDPELTKIMEHVNDIQTKYYCTSKGFSCSLIIKFKSGYELELKYMEDPDLWSSIMLYCHSDCLINFDYYNQSSEDATLIMKHRLKCKDKYDYTNPESLNLLQYDLNMEESCEYIQQSRKYSYITMYEFVTDMLRYNNKQSYKGSEILASNIGIHPVKLLQTIVKLHNNMFSTEFNNYYKIEKITKNKIL